LLEDALHLATRLRAAAVLLQLDALDSPEIVAQIRPPVKTILVTSASLPSDLQESRHQVLQLPFGSLDRPSRLSLALLLGVSRGLIGRHDRIISLQGPPGGGAFDTLRVVDVSSEVPALPPAGYENLLGDVEPQVLERVLEVALRISLEGREGRAVGTIFVVGDHEAVRRRTQQLIINPFKGHSEAERNVLDPSLEETIKELAGIDGAFLLRGDGVVEAAGAYLLGGDNPPRLPSGFGTRHVAAAGMTAVTGALAVVVSQSGGRISVFRSGELVAGLGTGGRG
jgi:diadenylate cyclase